MPRKTKILALAVALFCAASQSAGAQDVQSFTDKIGSARSVGEILRQVDALNEELKKGKKGQVRSIAVVGDHTNIAIGPGAVACSSIGVVQQKPNCVTGRSIQPKEGTDK